ncbi:uncharacterized protein LOC131996079 [Stomoxys calcitrans]|uniref:uncharacterized protein LOC131996079 n=1 Tax=Stomoxys calcitrans TaxID=35570 RepID=UPI0027E39B9A|nr:uncharacterized protein LOC131996079 [Stomoxys calcitrans]
MPVSESSKADKVMPEKLVHHQQQQKKVYIQQQPPPPPPTMQQQYQPHPQEQTYLQIIHQQPPPPPPQQQHILQSPKHLQVQSQQPQQQTQLGNVQLTVQQQQQCCLMAAATQQQQQQQTSATAHTTANERLESKSIGSYGAANITVHQAAQQHKPSRHQQMLQNVVHHQIQVQNIQIPKHPFNRILVVVVVALYYTLADEELHRINPEHITGCHVIAEFWCSPAAATNPNGTILTTYYAAKDDVKNRLLKTQSGAHMTLAKYKSRNAAGNSTPIVQIRILLSPLHSDQAEVRVTNASPVLNRPPAGSSVYRTSYSNYEIQTQHVLQNRDRNSAKMDLLEQVRDPFDYNTTIQCVENPGANIDFVVTVGFPSVQISWQPESLQQNSSQANSHDSESKTAAQSTAQHAAPAPAPATSATPTKVVSTSGIIKPSPIGKFY